MRSWISVAQQRPQSQHNNRSAKLSAVPSAIAACTAASLTLLSGGPPAQADTYQHVRTVSGAVRCVVSQAEVVCERTSADGFPQAPDKPGGHFNTARVTATGSFNWNDGNIGGSGQDTVLEYGQTYRFNGWTILPSGDGTRFTNDGTGHGMFVSIDNVSSF